MKLTEVMEHIRGAIKAHVDDLIATEPDPFARQALRRHRQTIIDRSVAQSEIETLRYQLEQAERRQLRAVEP